MSELQKRLREYEALIGRRPTAQDTLCFEAADALDALVEETSTQAQEIATLRARAEAALPEKMKEPCPCKGFGCDCGNYGDCASAAYASGWNDAIDAARGGA